MGTRFLAATRNPGKLREIRLLLEPLGIQVLAPDEVGWPGETIEDRPTLEENALKKAREGFAATGLATMADDTGLFVEALGGAPGVRSARFAGEAQDPVANCAKLLLSLEGVPAGKRGAEFRTVVALVGPGEERVFVGRCRGRITETPRGTAGFGYDPVFEPEGAAKTFAQMETDEKNRMSHRGRALRALRRALSGKSQEEAT